MYEITEKDLNRQILAKYEYRTYSNAFNFYVLSYGTNNWEIIRTVTVQSNWTQYSGNLRITYGNLDWVTTAKKDESFKPCTIGEMLAKS